MGIFLDPRGMTDSQFGGDEQDDDEDLLPEDEVDDEDDNINYDHD